LRVLFLAVFKGLFSPAAALKRAAERPGRVRRAALSVAAVGILYSLASLGLGLTGAVPLWPVWKGWGTDNYYFWQMVLVLPAALAAWGLIAAIIRGLGSRKAGPDGFGRALGSAGPALGGPLLVAWLPEAVQAALMAMGMGQQEWVAILSEPGPWQTLYLAVYALAAALAVRLLVAAAALAAGRGGPWAVMRGVLAAAAALALFLAFVR